MLRSGNDLKGLAIRATDGEIGAVDQFLFDDEGWAVRYMVVNTAGWLLKELVLLSPRSITGVDWDGRHVEVGMCRQQVEDAPPIATDEPVSRQMEAELATYYGYQPYWYGPGLWGAAGYPFGAGLATGYPAAAMVSEHQRAAETTERGDPHLRSTREVKGYAIRTRDGEIGEVRDFLMDDESWAIRYLVIDTGGWWSGKRVLIAPLWATAVSWEDKVIEINLTREQVRSGPEYNGLRLSRDDELLLHRHYQRPGYWESVLF